MFDREHKQKDPVFEDALYLEGVLVRLPLSLAIICNGPPSLLRILRNSEVRHPEDVRTTEPYDWMGIRMQTFFDLMLG